MFSLQTPKDYRGPVDMPIASWSNMLNSIDSRTDIFEPPKIRELAGFISSKNIDTLSFSGSTFTSFPCSLTSQKCYFFYPYFDPNSPLES
jgi:hypothetical protein